MERLKKNGFVSTHTIHTLYQILNCRTEDIWEYKTDMNESKGLTGI